MTDSRREREREREKREKREREADVTLSISLPRMSNESEATTLWGNRLYDLEKKLGNLPRESS